MKLSAIIFDMDGVLVDTETLMFDVFRTVFSPLGIYLSDEYQYRFIGKPLAANLADIHRDFNIEFDDSEILQRFYRTYQEFLSRHPLSPQAGILEIIDVGKKLGLRFALCTTTSRLQVEFLLKRLRANGRLDPLTLFAAIVTGNDVTYKKPHPEPYQTAAMRLNADPAACLAIEDTETGIASAKAAGCKTIALRQPYNRHMNLSAADRIVDNLHEVPQYLDVF